MEKKLSTGRLSFWDSKSNPLAPLTEKQKASIIELNTYNKRPIPQKVYCVLFLYLSLILKRHLLEFLKYLIFHMLCMGPGCSSIRSKNKTISQSAELGNCHKRQFAADRSAPQKSGLARTHGI